MCNPSYSEGSWFEVSPKQIVQEPLSQKYPTKKRAGGMAQVVEHLPSKCEALSSTPILQNNNNKKNLDK
jgi:hypothetical protein